MRSNALNVDVDRLLFVVMHIISMPFISPVNRSGWIIVGYVVATRRAAREVLMVIVVG